MHFNALPTLPVADKSTLRIYCTSCVKFHPKPDMFSRILSLPSSTVHTVYSLPKVRCSFLLVKPTKFKFSIFLLMIIEIAQIFFSSFFLKITIFKCEKGYPACLKVFQKWVLIKHGFWSCSVLIRSGVTIPLTPCRLAASKTVGRFFCLVRMTS